ncbi:hypothetical protein GWG65_09850 [Bradyrhizobium sp. CSA207]|uniref:hypothetical protein n=1 Tax=Bradyrhizobium sp. CSA207 TaxID=2698826 RepID=UPI0023AE878F|nr:hypothetical protein [Bradyrhizobium sp. CSA207]MDE5441746.1 hypothetical protein [Bradyrhizobium sp. CSA207]
MQVIGGATSGDSAGTVQRIALACACVVSLVLWLALNADFSNALLWAAKLEGHPISGTVGVSKVAICLSWSLLAFGLICHRYQIRMITVLALLAATLVAGIGSSVVDIKFFDLPVAKLIVQSVPLTLLYTFKLPLIAIALAYFIVTRRASAHGYERLSLAATLGLCAIMAWTGLFDVIYPSIAWR